MATIQTCPNEVLCCIFAHLNIFDLESIARTFNKKLYYTAYPFLSPSIPWIKNARSMLALFPPEEMTPFKPAFAGAIPPLNPTWSTYGHAAPKPPYTHASLGLDPRHDKYVCTSPPDLRSWMKLDGTFGWLEPLDPKMKAEWERYVGAEGEAAVATTEEVDALVKQVAELGLTLPVGFETFVRSKHLHYRIPSCMAWYYQLSPLTKAPKEVDNDAGGYIIKFHYDQQCCAYAYLYMQNDGSHCVLESGDDWHNELGDIEYYDSGKESDDEDESQGFGSDTATLHSLTFEEYLVSVYYEQLLWYGAQPFQGLKDYVAHVYRPYQGDTPYESSVESP
ncbi:hypothetical protein GQ53DRAFT_753973 [Thozetella sp. PMI_491]|nr:hypothetical protein GQ53DRAFT_753973 [Thozetella sp. PMI_491]